MQIFSLVLHHKTMISCFRYFTFNETISHYNLIQICLKNFIQKNYLIPTTECHVKPGNSINFYLFILLSKLKKLFIER